MATANPNAPALSREFAGHPISVPAVFTEGHVLTSGEAAWTNGQVATVLGNAFGGAIRRALEALDKERNEAHKNKTYTGPTVEGKNGKPIPAPAEFADLDWNPQSKFDEIFSAYEFAASTRGSGNGAKSDPTTALARTYAEVDLNARIASKGRTATEFRKVKMEDGRTKYTHLVDAQFESKKADYLERAKAEMADAAASVTEDDGIDLDAI